MLLLHTVSNHRLLDCAKVICALPINDQFLLMESTSINFIKHFYVVHKSWNDTVNKVPTLAHIQVSPETGNIRLFAWQPEYWMIDEPAKLKEHIFDLLSEVITASRLKEDE